MHLRLVVLVTKVLRDVIDWFNVVFLKLLIKICECCLHSVVFQIGLTDERGFDQIIWGINKPNRIYYSDTRIAFQLTWTFKYVLWPKLFRLLTQFCIIKVVIFNEDARFLPFNLNCLKLIQKLFARFAFKTCIGLYNNF